jgi:hypothetical protein
LEVSEVFELERFPFDRQILKVVFDIADVQLIPFPETFIKPPAFTTGVHQYVATANLGNWNLDDGSLTVFLKGKINSSTTSAVKCEVLLSRDPTFYLWNIVMVMVGICLIFCPFEYLSQCI